MHLESYCVLHQTRVSGIFSLHRYQRSAFYWLLASFCCLCHSDQLFQTEISASASTMHGKQLTWALRIKKRTHHFYSLNTSALYFSLPSKLLVSQLRNVVVDDNAMMCCSSNCLLLLLTAQDSSDYDLYREPSVIWIIMITTDKLLWLLINTITTGHTTIKIFPISWEKILHITPTTMLMPSKSNKLIFSAEQALAMITLQN